MHYLNLPGDFGASVFNLLYNEGQIGIYIALGAQFIHTSNNNFHEGAYFQVNAFRIRAAGANFI